MKKEYKMIELFYNKNLDELEKLSIYYSNIDYFIYDIGIAAQVLLLVLLMWKGEEKWKIKT